MTFVISYTTQVALMVILTGIVALVILLMNVFYQLDTNNFLDKSQIQAFAAIAIGMGTSIIALVVTLGIVWDQRRESKKQEKILRAIYKRMFNHDYCDSSD
ncbi:MAG: hypothetical protein D9C04_07670 [Nitrosopumilus sp. B06]|nr:MAG: hypothetical protein D9C04_07670 [Nitrosopumilus sp. B06]